ncbi:MAG: prepilin peptidase [Vagococcus salmoninarum]|uniref:prepilin peptidase n=1 Tax=Vagococcus salmoninarum TaxID=2739 RepID=UPI003F96FFEB
MPFILGSIFGSFLALFGQRLALKQSAITPRSHCQKCQTQLAWWQLIPILSFIILKGRCHHCQTKLPAYLLVMEALVGLLALALKVFDLWQVSLLPLLLIILSGLLLSITDLIDLIVEPRIFYFFTLTITLTIWLLPTPFTFHLSSALAVYLSLELLSILLPNSLGGGDLKLLTSWALFLGWEAVTVIICLASSFALCYLGVSRHSSETTPKLPFVPFLALALILYFFFNLL